MIETGIKIKIYKSSKIAHEWKEKNRLAQLGGEWSSWILSRSWIAQFVWWVELRLI